MELKYIDLSYLEQFTGGDAAVREQMLNLLRSEAEEGEQAILRLTRIGDTIGLERAMHHMKSTVAYLGNRRLSHTLEKNYELVQAGNLDEELIQDFLQQLNLIRTELNQVR